MMKKKKLSKKLIAVLKYRLENNLYAFNDP